MHQVFKSNTFKLSLISALLMSNVVYAEEFRQHEAHVHGHVEFNIAQDEKELLIDINAPSMDVIGFERMPKTMEEKTLFENAMQKLKDPLTLITLSKEADCQLTLSTISHTANEDEHDHKKTEQAHDDDKHDQHHEFNAEYHFECSHIEALNSIKTQWFEQFPNTKIIRANMLTNTVQTSAELAKNKNEIKL